MTMSGSWRIACKLCRTAKCGAMEKQPACDRCCRAGESCVYSQTQRPTKANLLQTITGLQDRVGQCYVVSSFSHLVPLGRFSSTASMF
ncbi:uncharacterized protein BDZ99DRAFT_144652 [Mytilinidion resinicola]|uniref:Zn(2)-C6 fungal-type domain-containing protein n=1 Tax=Mytilinidion resinicola TaxID=574789 RepID=A0A6A6Y7T8_9PEZI|nr:uncharacterized protein BDZ99DRAFT_144652 [Mytilinidion resinicola]KAF2804872.1 hypothetical protein BDZ99DRAFT_144652 [Mytilinidion resinicola]